MITVENGGVVRLDAAEVASLSDTPLKLPGRLPDLVFVSTKPPAAPPMTAAPAPKEPIEPDKPEEPEEPENPEEPEEPEEPEKPEEPNEPARLPDKPPSDGMDAIPPGITVFCTDFFLGCRNSSGSVAMIKER